MFGGLADHKSDCENYSIWSVRNIFCHRFCALTMVTNIGYNHWSLMTMH